MMRLALALPFLLGQSAAAQVSFEDMSDQLPPHIYSGGWEHFVGGGIAVFDCDGDALPDIFVAGGETPAKLMRNTGDFSFKNAGVPPLTGVTGAYPLDMDADGLMDLFVLRVGSNVVLRGGLDCSFTDVTAAWGIPGDARWSTAFTAWWGDGDQRPTMAVGNYVDRDDPNGPFEACDDNVLLTPVAEGYESRLLSPGYCALSILAAQDASGRKRLRLSNDRHYYVSEGKEQMWDIGEQRFLGPQDGWADVSVWGMGIASRDINGDGRDEVMLTSMGDQVLQLAEGNRYRAAAFEVGTYAQRPYLGGDGRPSTGWHAEFGDVDNDGLSDLFIAKGNVDQMPGMATRDPNNLLIQQKHGQFAERGGTAGIATFERSRGAALADFDQDGRLDLVVVNRRAKMELYRNVTPDTGNWIRVALQEEGGNRNAVGARVEVDVDGNKQTAQIVVGGGHAGGQALPLHFGLGDAVRATLKVVWPNDDVTESGALAGQTVVIRKAGQ